MSKSENTFNTIEEQYDFRIEQMVELFLMGSDIDLMVEEGLIDESVITEEIRAKAKEQFPFEEFKKENPARSKLILAIVFLKDQIIRGEWDELE